MFCSKCGEKLKTTDSFCTDCGTKVNEKITSATSKKKKEVIGKKSKDLHLSEEILSSLKKTYNITGALSIILGTFSVVVGMVVGFSPANIITDLMVSLTMNFPRLYFGYRMLANKTNNLDSTLRISRGMMVFLIVVAIFNIITGSSGWMYYILIYFYYRSYKETKNALKTMIVKKQ